MAESVAAPAVRRVAAAARVDVWCVSLASTPDARGSFDQTLTAEERARATRMRVGGERWIAARAALRRVLGHYLDLPPEHVPLSAGGDGKPRLARRTLPDLRFNLSHSDGIALVAVRLDHEVGVDVERIRDGVDGGSIASALFSPEERVRWAASTDSSPHEAFFRAWVRREALAKATGRGIIAPVSAHEIAAYTVRELPGIRGYAAAVASEGAGWDVALHED